MDIDKFVNNEITQFICEGAYSGRTLNLVKRQTENLAKSGDYSFSLQRIIWQKNLELYGNFQLSQNETRLEALKEIENVNGIQSLTNISSKWPIPIETLRVESERCILYLNRVQGIRYALKSALAEDIFCEIGSEVKSRSFRFKGPINESCTNLNSYRAQVLRSVLEKLAEYFVTIKNEADENCVTVEVKPIRYKSDNKRENRLVGKTVSIFCGDVTVKESNSTDITTSEYIRLRSKDMQLMAMHKYGVRVKNEEHFRKLIECLGNAAAKVDLLEAKHTSPVSLKRNGNGCTKGASFILYNSARIETLLRNFEDRVRSGLYPDLPELDIIDINLLTEEEEWMLIFNYVLAFPNLVKRCLDGLEEGKCAPHLLLQYVCGMVGVFSVYYRRVRVLLDGREHLVPLIHARIYLVKCIREVLNRILAILSIDPLQCM